MQTMTPNQFIEKVDSSTFEGTKKNVMVAVRRILKDLDPDFEFRFDAHGVRILFDMFQDAEARSAKPLSPRVMNNYKTLFLQAAHMCASTPVNKTYKVVWTLAID